MQPRHARHARQGDRFTTKKREKLKAMENHGKPGKLAIEPIFRDTFLLTYIEGILVVSSYLEMGQTISRWEVSCGDVDDPDMEHALDYETCLNPRPTFVVDYNLNNSQLAQLTQAGITGGVPFTIGEGVFGRPSGPEKHIRMVETVAGIVVSRIECLKNDQGSLSFSMIYDAEADCKVSILSSGNTPVPVTFIAGKCLSFEYDGLKAVKQFTLSAEANATKCGEIIVIDTANSRVVSRSVVIDSKIFLLSSIYGAEVEESQAPQAGPGKERESACVICLENQSNVAVLPCRHLCLCKECASSMISHGSKCPMCRKTIQLFIRLVE